MTTWAEPQQLALLADPLDVRFAEYHQANPHVYAALVNLARQWKSAGHSTCAMGMLFELLRWEEGVSGVGDQFALNASYRSRYSRLIEANEPDLLDFFTKRRLHSESEYA